MLETLECTVNSINVPALFSSDSVRLFALFGGQATSEDILSELFRIFDTYEPLVGEYFHQMSKVLFEISRKKEFQKLVNISLDLELWRQNDQNRPLIDVCNICTISLPIICLLQLMNFYICFKSIKMEYKKFLSLFKATSGHSQGLISSFVISRSHSEQEFIHNSKTALEILFSYWSKKSTGVS